MGNKSPHGDDLKDSDVFRGDGEHVEGSPQVWGEGDVVDGVGDRHQSLHFRVFPLRHWARRHILTIIRVIFLTPVSFCMAYKKCKKITRLECLPRVFIILVDLDLPAVRHVAVVAAHCKHWLVGTRAGGW